MTLTKLLFEPTIVRSPGRILAWWERRRLVFNIAVGVAGIGTLGWVTLVDWLVGKGALTVAPWQLVVLYGVAANVCYTLGPVAEIGIERFLKRPVYGLGPALFRHGLVFSIGLTLFPAAMITAFAILNRFFR